MKKTVVILGLLLMAGAFFINAAEETCDPKTFSITVGAGGRNFSENRYKEVYDGTPMIYSIDFAVRVMPVLEAFLHTDYLSKDGKTTFTQEDTTLKITPLELGLRYIVTQKKSCTQKLFPYVGAGAGYYMIKEEFAAGVPIENVDEKRLGFFGEGGIRFYLIKSVFIDAKLKYIAVSVKLDETVKLGGLAYMGGIGFSF
jgi:outer membrane protein W